MVLVGPAVIVRELLPALKSGEQIPGCGGLRERHKDRLDVPVRYFRCVLSTNDRGLVIGLEFYRFALEDYEPGAGLRLLRHVCLRYLSRVHSRERTRR